MAPPPRAAASPRLARPAAGQPSAPAPAPGAALAPRAGRAAALQSKLPASASSGRARAAARLLARAGWRASAWRALGLCSSPLGRGSRRASQQGRAPPRERKALAGARRFLALPSLPRPPRPSRGRGGKLSALAARAAEPSKAQPRPWRRGLASARLFLLALLLAGSRNRRKLRAARARRRRRSTEGRAGRGWRGEAASRLEERQACFARGAARGAPTARNAASPAAARLAWRGVVAPLAGLGPSALCLARSSGRAAEVRAASPLLSPQRKKKASFLRSLALRLVA